MSEPQPEMKVVIHARAGRHGDKFRVVLISANGYEICSCIVSDLERARELANNDYGSLGRSAELVP